MVPPCRLPLVRRLASVGSFSWQGMMIRLGMMAVLVTMAVPCLADEMVVANAGFEEGTETAVLHWSWWCRKGTGGAERVKEPRHGGNWSVRIHHEGDEDWNYSNDAHFAVKPGQNYVATAWTKVESGHVALSTVALEGKKTLRWDIGSGSSKSSDWTKIEAFIEVPESCDQIYLRFGGTGKTVVCVDDVAISPYTPQNTDKPKVTGYATERVRERLDREVAAVSQEKGGVYVSWRLLNTDPADVAFNVYRKDAQGATKLNAEPIRKTTDFVDSTAPADGETSYFVRSVTGGQEGPVSSSSPLLAKGAPYVSIPLQGKYQVQKIGIGDLDGDGRYDYVVKQPQDNIDPWYKYWKRSPDTYKLEAYRNDGKFLWRHDLGWSIERGIWYSPYVVFDLDGDGKAEVAVKTGEGDPRDADGRVKSGPEYLTILDGQTGQPVTRVDWPSREPFYSKYPPDAAYNLASRNQIGVAYLDGKTPCLIVERGTYNYITVIAYEYHDRQLRELWRWDNTRQSRKYQGQGAHWMHCADIDNDGRDEVLIGSAVLDDNGTSLWSTGLGHPDNFYLGHIDPSLPGLQIYYNIESRNSRNGMCLVDAKTGKILWGHDEPTMHIHASGMCSPIMSNLPGCQCLGGEHPEVSKDKFWLRDCKGNVLPMTKEFKTLTIRTAYWDATPYRAMLRGSKITKYQGATLPPEIKGSLVAVADILGDWREEIITTLPGEMRIYTTTIPAADRRACLMQDPIYRLDVAHAAMGYYQNAMTSYDLATGK